MYICLQGRGQSWDWSAVRLGVNLGVQWSPSFLPLRTEPSLVVGDAGFLVGCLFPFSRTASFLLLSHPAWGWRLVGRHHHLFLHVSFLGLSIGIFHVCPSTFVFQALQHLLQHLHALWIAMVPPCMRQMTQEHTLQHRRRTCVAPPKISDTCRCQPVPSIRFRPEPYLQSKGRIVSNRKGDRTGFEREGSDTWPGHAAPDTVLGPATWHAGIGRVEKVLARREAGRGVVYVDWQVGSRGAGTRDGLATAVRSTDAPMTQRTISGTIHAAQLHRPNSFLSTVRGQWNNWQSPGLLYFTKRCRARGTSLSAASRALRMASVLF